MKPMTKSLYGRNHRHGSPESTRIPKSCDSRKGTKTAVRRIVVKEIKEALCEST